MAGIKAHTLIKYPPELFDADWQKKKELLSKTVSTGLGAELKKGEALHKKVDWSQLDPARDSPKKKEDLEKGIQDAKSYYTSNVKPLIAQLKEIEKVAKETEKVMTAKKYKKSAAAAAAIAKAADLFSISCQSIDMQADIDEALQKIDKLNELARANLEGSIKKFLVGAKTFLSGDASKEEWDRLIKQNGRSVSNCVRQLDAYNKAFWQDFTKFYGFDQVTLKIFKDGEEFDETRRKLVRAAVKQVAEIAKFKE